MPPSPPSAGHRAALLLLLLSGFGAALGSSHGHRDRHRRGHSDAGEDAASAAAAPSDPFSDHRPEPRTCSASCMDRQLAMQHMKAVHKVEILRKLGMTSAPNVTVADINTDLIAQLTRRRHHHHRTAPDMLSDQPADDSLGGRAGSSAAGAADSHASDIEQVFLSARPSSGGGGGISGGWLDEDFENHVRTKQINLLAQKLPTSGTGISFNSEIIRHKLRQQHPEIIFFQLSSDELRQHWRQVTEAMLWIHLPKAHVENEHVWVNISYVSADKTGHTWLTKAAWFEYKLRAQAGGWAKIKPSITTLAQHWHEHPDQNLGMVIRIKSLNTHRDISVGLQSNMRPMLTLDVKDQQLNRHKRHNDKMCTEETNPQATHCCLWPFQIDFQKDFGWKWVISPRTYEANLCSGDCSLGVHKNVSPHSYMRQMSDAAQGSADPTAASSSDSTTASAADASASSINKFVPCCAPQKMSAITMVYLNKYGEIILGKVPRMKVERCGCA